MLWLTTQMWLLLLITFVMGMICMWILNYQSKNDDGYYDQLAHINARTEEIENRDGNFQHNDDDNNALDHYSRREDKEDYHPKKIERRKIYENNIDDDHNALDDLNQLDNVRDEKISTEKEKPTTNLLKTVERTRPQLFGTTKPDTIDDLKRIKGIGPTLETNLNKIGIYNFSQIAKWEEGEIAWIDNQIDFPGRVQREKWVSQAKELAVQAQNTLGHPPKMEEEAINLDTIEGDFSKKIEQPNTEISNRGISKHDDEYFHSSSSKAENNISKANTMEPSMPNNSHLVSRSETKPEASSPAAEKHSDNTSQTSSTKTEGSATYPESMLDRLRARRAK